MIAWLQGEILVKQLPILVLNVNGVGYELNASMSTFYKLPDVGASVSLLVQQVIREDAHTLYGFYDEAERHLFRLLIKVNGVGPKLALAILSSIEPQQFIQCIQWQDSSSLIKIPGVGKKTAERLIIEMRDRLGDDLPASTATSNESVAVITPIVDNNQEATRALEALGYKPAEARRALASVPEAASMSVEELIRQALKTMVSA